MEVDAPTVVQVFQSHLALVFGWPHSVFSDNGMHFTAHLLKTTFNKHGVVYITAPTTHLCSVGMIKYAI